MKDKLTLRSNLQDNIKKNSSDCDVILKQLLNVHYILHKETCENFFTKYTALQPTKIVLNSYRPVLTKQNVLEILFKYYFIFPRSLKL